VPFNLPDTIENISKPAAIMAIDSKSTRALD
jgi:hypothetical protein